MAELYSSAWSEIANDNDVSNPDGWPGGTTFPNIPPTGREMMGAIKREWNRSHPTLTTGGDGDQVTLTPTTPIIEYVAGQIFAAKLNATLGAGGGTTRTLSVSGKGGKKIYIPALAGGYTQTAQSGGEAKAGQVVFFRYDATLDSGAGGFVMYSILPPASPMESIDIALTSESGAVPASDSYRFTFRTPYAFALTDAKASLKTAQTSGAKVTITANFPNPGLGPIFLPLFSTPLTIDNGKTTSVAAAVPVVLAAAAASIAADTEILIGVTSGNGTARGLKVALLGHQT